MKNLNSSEKQTVASVVNYLLRNPTLQAAQNPSDFLEEGILEVAINENKKEGVRQEKISEMVASIQKEVHQELKNTTLVAV